MNEVLFFYLMMSSVIYPIFEPVGIYEIEISLPDNVMDGELFNVVVRVRLTGINESSVFYNVTLFESIRSIRCYIVETGYEKEKTVNTLMLTNVFEKNGSLFPPSPHYVVNNSLVEKVFTFDSSYIRKGSYTIRVEVIGYRVYFSGLAVSSSDFKVVKEAEFRVVSKGGWLLLLDFLPYITFGLAICGIILGIINLHLLRRVKR